MNSLEEYCISHSTDESAILKKIKSYTFANEKAPQMIVGSIIGNVLSLLIQSSKSFRNWHVYWI